MVHNTGDARATGVRVKLSFPNELLVLSTEEMLAYRDKDPLSFSRDAYTGWDLRFESPNQSDTLNIDNKFYWN